MIVTKMSLCVKDSGGVEKFRRSNRLNAKNKSSTAPETLSAASNLVVEEKECKEKAKNAIVSKAHHKPHHNRKRSQVMPGNKSHKRRRMDYSRRFIPPTKFLLGGNIHDPLNLNSLQDEEINRAMNAVTPKSSPLPTPQHRKGEIEVIIPPNICDPLNLAQCDDENTADYEAQLISPLKKIKRTKKKRKKSGCVADLPGEETQLNETSQCGLEDDPATAVTSSSSVCPIKAQTDPEESSTATLFTSESLPPVPTIEPATPDEEAQSSTENSTSPIEPTEVASCLAEVTLAAPSHPILAPPLKKVPKKDSSTSLDLKLLKRFDSKDKIVSPVVPQPTNRVPHSRYRQLTPEIAKGQKTPNFREKNCKFQYGNYNKYYGYRNVNQEVDPRIKVLEKFKHLFERKDVLDIGCNIGHITLTLARDFNATSVVGLDIDKHLIKVARTNIKHYVNCKTSPLDEHEYSQRSKSTYASFSGVLSPLEQERKYEPVGSKKSMYASFCEPSPSCQDVEQKREGALRVTPQENPDVFFPISMPIVYGGINTPGLASKRNNQFPHNVSFVQGNYVLDSDELLNVEHAQFDVILCLSVTKWFHLNWGDAGLKRVFKRMYAQLRHGGVLILEPQSWNSYKKKRKLTESIWRNYQSIEFFPHHFTQYLLSEVGFTRCETLGNPLHSSKGFQRPIKMFTKGYERDSNKGKDGNPSGEWT